jgi:hypothetical protein
MRSGCITKVRFNLLCDVLKPIGAPETVLDISTEGTLGHWEYRQNEDSGAIERQWIDDPITPDVNEAYTPGVIHDVPLTAHGIVTTGLRGAGNSENFGALVEEINYVKATFPKGVNITVRDRVRNIRNKGEVIWREEQMPEAPPTIFNVMGLTPILDPWANVLEYSVLLQRAEVQSA